MDKTCANLGGDRNTENGSPPLSLEPTGIFTVNEYPCFAMFTVCLIGATGLTGIVLASARLTRAGLSGSGLTGAGLLGGGFTGSGHTGTDLTGSGLTGAGLFSVGLIGVDAEYAEIKQ